LAGDKTRQRFDDVALPHLDAAYNLARWLTRNDADAADVVQEAFLRALTYFEGYRGENPRAWLLMIVRNTCYRWLERNRSAKITPISPENEAAVESAAGLGGEPVLDPEALVGRQRDAALLNELIEQLPPLFREVLILREVEDLAYRDISEVLGVPIGTVMSRLARARGLLKDAWYRQEGKEGKEALR
jgi:RNA polymerase sigma-70 factor (ECF subfamily)